MIRSSFERLAASYGPQHWWPAEHAFEVMVGAVLVQRTSWHNAELAVGALRDEGLLQPELLARADEPELCALIRSAGFYRAKARRLVGLARFVERAGGLSALARIETPALRQQLLELDGIGPETADAILLYCFDRPVCVVDAYLRRWFGRMSGQTDIADDELRRRITAQLREASELNEFHALIVEHGKRYCTARPRCDACGFRQQCAYAAG